MPFLKGLPVTVSLLPITAGKNKNVLKDIKEIDEIFFLADRSMNYGKSFGSVNTKF